MKRTHTTHNGTLIDKRNGQKGMLGTRIIHVLCLWWKSHFAAMVRETISEGGDEHFSPSWHGFLRGRRREGAMLAQRCMGWHDLSGKIPVHKVRNDGGGKRASVQGGPLDGTETT